MNEILLIIAQIFFILFLVNSSKQLIPHKFTIKNFSYFDNISLNIIIFINILLLLSLLAFNINIIFYSILFVLIICNLNKIKNRSFFSLNFEIINISFFLLIFIFTLDLATKIKMGWDAEFFWYLKTLNFYQNNNISNLNNLIVADYPHLGSLIWSLFWKYPFNYSEYFGRITYLVIFFSSIYSFYSSIKTDFYLKIILILLTTTIIYNYELFSGLQEIMVFSIILIIVKFSYLLINSKNLTNQKKLVLFILLATNAVCWIKNEALIFAGIFIFSLLFVSELNIKVKKYLIFGTLIILLVRSGYLLINDISFESSEFGKTFDSNTFDLINFFDDLKITLFYYIVYFIQMPIMIIGLLVFLYILFYEKKSYSFKKFMIIFLIINFSFTIFAFLFNFEDVEWQIRTGMKRFMFESAAFYMLPLLHILNSRFKINDKRNKI